MSYIEGNKAAWEEAFEKRRPDWGSQNHEYDYDIGITDAYDGKGFPLSFILIAEKS